MPSGSTAWPHWLAEQGETVVRRSPLKSPLPRTKSGAPPIILIDTIGELAAVWGLADVAFVGGSLHAGRGGQNMMEPAAYGASVMFGPHIANFRETVDQLLERNAARQVADADELTVGLLADLDDPEAATARGAAGRTLRPGPERRRPGAPSPSSIGWWNRRWPSNPLEHRLAFLWLASLK